MCLGVEVLRTTKHNSLNSSTNLGEISNIQSNISPWALQTSRKWTTSKYLAQPSQVKVHIPWCCCHFNAWPIKAISLEGGTTVTSTDRAADEQTNMLDNVIHMGNKLVQLNIKVLKTSVADISMTMINTIPGMKLAIKNLGQCVLVSSPWMTLGKPAPVAQQRNCNLETTC